MSTRHTLSFFLLFLFLLLMAACYFTYTASADNPSAGKTKKAVEAADNATKNAQQAWDVAFGAALAAAGTKYPDNEAGREAAAADNYADTTERAAEAAVKAAAEARQKACESGKPEDAKAADEAEKSAREAEARADAAAAEADNADAKADPFGKGLQKKKRDANRALRAAFKAAMAAICFARQCAQLMDESSEQNKKKKQDTLEDIKGFGSSAEELLALGSPARGQVQTSQGRHEIKYDTLSGSVIVNLPDDMRAGDTITGTVTAEARGDNDEHRKANAAGLSELKLNFGSKFPKDKKELMILITPRIIIRDEENSTPPSPNQTNFTTKVPDSFDYTIGLNAPRADTQTVTITINEPIWFINNQPTTPPPAPSPNDFHFPEIIQQGRTVQISGPNGKKIFDGNSANTRLMYGPAGSTVQDFEKNTENVSGGFGLIKPLAESPRQCVFEVPTTIAGPVQFYLKEGALETVAPANSVGLNLSGKTNLLKNEHTDLRIDVFGLQGIKKPVPLTIEAQGVIRLDGGNYQQFVIQPSQVDPQGRYTTKIGGTGVEVGGWTATATVVTLPPYILLRDPSPPQQLLVDSRTGHYDFCGPGEKFSGDGHVKADGCSFYFFQHSNEEVAIGVLNACNLGNRYWVFFGGLASLTVDLRVKVDNANPPRKRVYFNPLNRPLPPVQDTSAFATCP